MKCSADRRNGYVSFTDNITNNIGVSYLVSPRLDTTKTAFEDKSKRREQFKFPAVTSSNE